MDIRLMRFFVALYEERNMTLAAEKCYVSQPSISNGIKQLEDILKTSLFQRVKKGVEATEEGHHLYPNIKRILKEIDELSHTIQTEKEDKYFFKLAVMPDISSDRLATFYEKIRLLSPNVHLELLDYHDKQADARITLLDFKTSNEIFLPLWREDYKLCMLHKHPLAKKKVVHLEDLHTYNFVECPPCEAHQQSIGLLSCSNKYIQKTSTSQYKSGVLALVKAGFGISFLPEGLIENDPMLYSPEFEGPNMFRSIGLAYQPEKVEIPIIAKLVNYYQGQEK